MTELEDQDNPISYDLDRFPLIIEMIGTETQKQAWLLGSVDATTPPFPAIDNASFSLSWRQKDSSVWLQNHHTGFGKETMGGQDCWTSKAWIVLKLKRKLVITCHAEVAYEVHYKDLWDSQGDQRSIKDLTKSVTHIWFGTTSTELKIKQLGL